MRDGAIRSLSRRRASLAASPVLSLASAPVRRSGESGAEIWLLRVGLNRSVVTVWACVAVPRRAISTRHGNAARRIVPRLNRPLAGPAITMKLLQQRQILIGRAPNTPENVVNGVKTIMVNEPLRADGPRRIAKSAMLGRGPGPKALLPGRATWPIRNR